MYLKSKELSAALLAGGQSRRFGASKMQAMFRGKRLIDHALATADLISDDIMIISGAQPLPPDIQTPAFQDIIPDKGPLGGLLTALHVARADWVAILPVDMPLLSHRIYEALLLRREQDAPVIAQSHLGPEPLVSLWPQKVLPDIEKCVKSQDLKMKHVLSTLGAVFVPLEKVMPGYQREWFLNINYQKDLPE